MNPLLMAAVLNRQRSQVAAGGLTSYSTSFAATENPMSEGGKWVRGGGEGSLWTNPRTSGGLCFGTQTGSSGHDDDSVAHLDPSVGISQLNHRVTLGLNLGGSPNSIQETECLLRFLITNGNARGYEILIAHDGSYAQLVRWNGGLDSFVIMASVTAGLPLSVSNGASWLAEINGPSISTRLNGSLLTWNDNISGANATAFDVQAWAVAHGGSYFSTGNPGVGLFTQTVAQTNQFCAADFLAESLA